MELTRETVELIALSFLDDGLSFEQREAMCRLVDSDAALRADRDKMRQANEAMTKERDVLKVRPT